MVLRYRYSPVSDYPRAQKFTVKEQNGDLQSLPLCKNYATGIAIVETQYTVKLARTVFEFQPYVYQY